MARKPADQSVNREAILLAAADVLRQNGYEATTMKDIAARVGLTAASLYHHFKSKDFLLLSVLEIGLEHAIARLEPLLHATDLPCSERLRRMIATHIIEVADNTAVGAAMVFEIRSLMNAKLSPRNGLTEADYAEFIERREAFFRRRDVFEGLFKQIIRQGINSGEFRPVDAGIVTKAMMGAQNWVGVWYKPTGRLSGPQVAEIMADTFIHSLLNATPQPAPRQETSHI
ncbi:MAG: TetR/AcrR family transcriptional regulator [Anaerolineae bacterium]|nr:TetR/AcrR family transcriptional regulator [Anaerolineae bacterium]MDW8171804.1 TetR/AcrR family transcriptional regulator [Anaerolineae bacterium]